MNGNRARARHAPRNMVGDDVPGRKVSQRDQRQGRRPASPVDTESDAMTQPQAVLDYWFGDIAPDGTVSEAKQTLWFTKRDETDQDIRRRFGRDVERALAGELDGWRASPQGSVALVLLLDQFTRNIFRDTPRAFAGDPQALDIALTAWDTGLVQGLRTLEQVFLSMPLMHAEEVAAQERSVVAFQQLRDAAPPALKEMLAGNHKYAVAHRDIVARFGRFPHRNAILGRSSTPEEVEFLKQPGSSF